MPTSTIKSLARGRTSIAHCHSQRHRAHERALCPSRQPPKPLVSLRSSNGGSPSPRGGHPLLTSRVVSSKEAGLNDEAAKEAAEQAVAEAESSAGGADMGRISKTGKGVQARASPLRARHARTRHARAARAKRTWRKMQTRRSPPAKRTAEPVMRTRRPHPQGAGFRSCSAGSFCSRSAGMPGCVSPGFGYRLEVEGCCGTKAMARIRWA